MRFERSTRISGIAGLVFLTFAWLTTQIPGLRTVVPFTDDPYDAVTSFAIIAIGVVGGTTLIRWLAQARRPPDADVERRIALGGSIVTGIAAIAVATDLVALIVVGVPAPGAGALLALVLLGVTVVVVAFAVAVMWSTGTDLRARARQPALEPDLIDDLVTIARTLGAQGVASRCLHWVETSPLSPRRHRVLAGVLGAGLAGVAAVIWHALREGTWASPAAAAFFGCLVALGVIGPYLIGLEPLRLLRPDGVGRPDGVSPRTN